MTSFPSLFQKFPLLRGFREGSSDASGVGMRVKSEQKSGDELHSISQSDAWDPAIGRSLSVEEWEGLREGHWDLIGRFCMIELGCK